LISDFHFLPEELLSLGILLDHKKNDMKKSIIPIVALLFLVSCVEDTIPTPDPILSSIKTDLLCASPWKVTASTVDPALDIDPFGTQVTDLYSVLDPCEKDDITTFQTNNRASLTEGIKCNYTKQSSWTWSFDASETKLIQNDSNTSDIIELTETTLKLSREKDGDDLIFGTSGVTYTFLTTYKH